MTIRKAAARQTISPLSQLRKLKATLKGMEDHPYIYFEVIEEYKKYIPILEKKAHNERDFINALNELYENIPSLAERIRMPNKREEEEEIKEDLDFIDHDKPLITDIISLIHESVTQKGVLN